MHKTTLAGQPMQAFCAVWPEAGRSTWRTGRFRKAAGSSSSAPTSGKPQLNEGSRSLRSCLASLRLTARALRNEPGRAEAGRRSAGRPWTRRFRLHAAASSSLCLETGARRVSVHVGSESRAPKRPHDEVRGRPQLEKVNSLARSSPFSFRQRCTFSTSSATAQVDESPSVLAAADAAPVVVVDERPALALVPPSDARLDPAAVRVLRRESVACIKRASSATAVRAAGEGAVTEGEGDEGRTDTAAEEAEQDGQEDESVQRARHDESEPHLEVVRL